MIPPCQWYQAIYALHATWPHLLIMNKEKFFTRNAVIFSKAVMRPRAVGSGLGSLVQGHNF